MMCKNFIRILALTIIIAVSNAASYGISGMVTRVDGQNIIINKGSGDNITADQELYVHRMGKPIGKIKIIKVDSYSSTAVITLQNPNEDIKTGDVVSSEPFSVKYTPPPPETSGSSNSSSSGSGKSSGDCTASYTEKLKQQIKTASFKSGPKGKVSVGLGEVTMIARAAGSGSSVAYTDPWMLVMMGTSLLNQYTTSRKTGQHSGVDVAVTYFDEGLIDAQAHYFASKEGISDESQIKELKNGIIQQMGLDSYVVFHVKVRNNGNTTLQLAPFKWHMYLMNTQGQKVRASKYDEALDKGMGPKGEEQGYIYFPRTDESGNTVKQGSLVKISLESILGGNADLIWR